MASSSQSMAGVNVPNTPLVNAAISFAREHLDDMTYNHIMRSLLLGFAVADKIPSMQERDREVHAIAAIMHDMSWDAKGTFTSPDKRFEVDSANAARTFITEHIASSNASDSGWDKHRLQLLWDAIALHTTPSIAQYKEVEVAMNGLGIGLDFGGVNMAPPGSLSQQEWEAIVKEYPRTGFRAGVTEVMCNLCRTKPDTTYDNFVSDFGEELVPGYFRKGRRPYDFMTATVD